MHKILQEFDIIMTKTGVLKHVNKEKTSAQLGFFTRLEDQLNQKHPLFQLAHQIDWDIFERSFSKHYKFDTRYTIIQLDTLPFFSRVISLLSVFFYPKKLKITF
jgi:hypothetical protein